MFTKAGEAEGNRDNKTKVFENKKSQQQSCSIDQFNFLYMLLNTNASITCSHIYMINPCT